MFHSSVLFLVMIRAVGMTTAGSECDLEMHQ